MRVKSKWLWFFGFALAWLALRVFWITCDTGIPAVWEYGFHTTDEGYYLCGGKEKFLWGAFVDLTRQEALNYCYSYGTHWISYLAHLCFGLSTWAWRIPFVLLAFVAWMMMYRTIERHSGSAFAFATCLAASSVPLVVTYERGFSNDATIASLVAIAYALASSGGIARLVGAAVVTSLIATVKPAVLVFTPIILSSALAVRRTRSRWLDAGIFLLLTIALPCLWKGLSALSVLNVAESNGITTGAVLAQVNATYGLPTVWDIQQDFRALASFPRDPSIKTMGATILLISVVPVFMFLRGVIRRKWNRHLLLYLMLPLYAYALNVINSMYTHYFLPLIILLPALFSAIREDMSEEPVEKVEWKKLGVGLSLLAGVLLLAVLFLLSYDAEVDLVAAIYSRIHNLPAQNPWRLTWPFLTIGTIVGVAALTCCRGVKVFCRESWIWAIVLFLLLSTVFAALPAALLAPRMHLASADYYSVLALNLVVGGALVTTLLVWPSAWARRGFAAGALVVTVFASYIALPTWRAASYELVSRRAHYDAALAAELKRLVPPDAIVLGERTDQAFMSLPIRTVSTFQTASNPIPYVERILKKDPAAKLYALIDKQCAYNLQHFREHAKEYRLEPILQFQMPSFSSGQLSPVYLCKVIPNKGEQAVK